MASIVSWFKQLVGGSSGRSAAGFRSPQHDEADDDIEVTDEDVEEFYETEAVRQKVRSLRKEELAAAIQSERDCRASLENIKKSMRKHKLDRRMIISQEKTCRAALEQYHGPEDAEKLQQIEQILNIELPQSLSIIDMNINKCKINIEKLEEDMESLGKERERVVAGYLKTFAPGEAPDLNDMPPELASEIGHYVAVKRAAVASGPEAERLEGEENLYGENSDSDLEINDDEVEADELSEGDIDYSDEETKSSPLLIAAEKTAASQDDAAGVGLPSSKKGSPNKMTSSSSPSSSSASARKKKISITSPAPLATASALATATPVDPELAGIATALASTSLDSEPIALDEPDVEEASQNLDRPLVELT